MIKFKFSRGDLVKNAIHVNWRDQTARGVVVESHHTATMVHGKRNQVVTVKWLCPPDYAKKCSQSHYSSGLDLVASAGPRVCVGE